MVVLGLLLLAEHVFTRSGQPTEARAARSGSRPLERRRDVP